MNTKTNAEALLASGVTKLEVLAERALTSRFLRRLAFAVALLILAKSAADWTWRVVRAPEAPILPSASKKLRRAEPDLARIYAARFFGDDVRPEGSGAALRMASTSASNMTLVGAIAAGRNSLALISVGGKPAEPFALGQTVGSGSVLNDVFPDHVTLRRNGLLDNLSLAGAAPSFASSAADKEIQQKSPGRFVVKRDALKAALGSPDVLLQTAVATVSDGLALTAVQPGSIYEKLGLTSGCVIHSVNGKPIRTPQDLLSLYQEIGASNQIQLDTTQNGGEEKLRYEIE